MLEDSWSMNYHNKFLLLIISTPLSKHFGARFWDTDVNKLLRIDFRCSNLDPSVLPFELENEINNLIAERDKARSDKNFKLADEIRDKLKEMGVSIEDSNSGTKWRVD